MGFIQRIIQKRLLGQDDWVTISLQQCLQETEGSGYYKKKTVEAYLKEGGAVNTPFAEYAAFYRYKCYECGVTNYSDLYYKIPICLECGALIIDEDTG